MIKNNYDNYIIIFDYLWDIKTTYRGKNNCSKTWKKSRK